MVPLPGIEPGSSPYESDASPQCFKGITKIDKRPTSPNGDAAGLWMFTMSNSIGLLRGQIHATHRRSARTHPKGCMRVWFARSETLRSLVLIWAILPSRLLAEGLAHRRLIRFS